MKSGRFWVWIGVLGLLWGGITPVGACRWVAYPVQPGDTLFLVARRYGLSVEALATANGLPTTAWLYAGQSLVIPGIEEPVTADFQTPGSPAYIVRPDDTLLVVALRHLIPVDTLAAANGLTRYSRLYVGQPLLIPGAEPPAAPTPAPVSDGPYIVQPGDNLFRIALNHGVTLAALRAANGLLTDVIYVGQVLKIPEPGAAETVAPPPIDMGSTEGKWIDVNLTTQTVTAYEGETPVYSTLASTGMWGTPTVEGTYYIYAKYVSAPMSGPGYYLPNVPHIMYFFKGYGLHGAYWHNNFGTPMSHGCVNLSLPDAEWFYNWAPMNTKVVSHY